MRRHLSFAIVTACFAAIFTACSNGAQPTTAEEADDAASATLRWLAGTYGLLASRPADQYLAGTVQRLTDAARNNRLRKCEAASSFVERPPPATAWRIFLLRDRTPNAFSLGAHTIVLSAGLIGALDSEGELAAVISHEMAHQLLGHVDEAMPSGQTMSGGSRAPASVLSLDQELAADAASLCLLDRGGFPLEASVTALTKGYRRDGAAVSANAIVTQRIVALERRLPEFSASSFFPGSSRSFNRFKKEVLKAAADSP